VRDEDNGLAVLLPHVDEFFLHVPASLLVERAEWLIHEHGRSVDRQRSSEAGTLLHTAGQLFGVLVLKASQADDVDLPLRFGVALRLAHATHFEAESDVVPNRRPRHEGKVLEDDGALLRGAFHGFVVDDNLMSWWLTSQATITARASEA